MPAAPGPISHAAGVKIVVPVTIGVFRCFGDACEAGKNVDKGISHIKDLTDDGDLAWDVRKGYYKAVLSDSQVRPFAAASILTAFASMFCVGYAMRFFFVLDSSKPLWRSSVSLLLAYTIYFGVTSWIVLGEDEVGGFTWYFFCGALLSIAGCAVAGCAMVGRGRLNGRMGYTEVRDVGLKVDISV